MLIFIKKNFLLFILICYMPTTSYGMDFTNIGKLQLIKGTGIVIITAGAGLFLLGEISLGIKHIIDYPNVAWYDHLIPYTAASYLVDMVHFFKSRIRFWQLSKSGLSKEQQIVIITTELNDIKEKLLDKEQTLRNAFLNEMKIDINDYLQLFETPLLIFHKTIPKNNSNTTVLHDTFTDDFLLRTTKDLLENHNLNSNGYAIKEDLDGPVFAAYEHAEFECPSIIDLIRNPNKVKITSNPSIRFNPDTCRLLSERNKLAVIAHEVTHAKMQHVEKQCLLQSHMTAKQQANQSNIDMSSLQKKLSAIETIHEQQADIFPSINDNNISSCMREKRQQVDYYVGHLYLGHYMTLTIIDESHKLISWIKNKK